MFNQKRYKLFIKLIYFLYLRYTQNLIFFHINFKLQAADIIILCMMYK